MRYLLIGVISLFFTGCAKKEYYKSADYYFVNNTSFDIVYPIGFKEYNVKANSTVVVSKIQVSNKNLDGNYSTPFHADNNSNTAYIPFSIKLGNKCLVFSEASKHSLFDIKSYVNNGQIDKRKYKFTYTFTEEDYSRATDCQ